MGRHSSAVLAALRSHVATDTVSSSSTSGPAATPSADLVRVGQSFVRPGDKGYAEDAVAYDGTEAVWDGGNGWDGFEPDPAALQLGITFAKLPGGEHLSWGVQLDGLDTQELASDPAAHQPELRAIAAAVHRFQVVKLPKQTELTAEGHVALAEELNRYMGGKQPIQRAADLGCPDENCPPSTDKVTVIGRKGDGWKEEHGIPIVNTVKGIQWPEMGACSWVSRPPVPYLSPPRPNSLSQACAAAESVQSVAAGKAPRRLCATICYAFLKNGSALHLQHTDGSAYPDVGTVTVMHMVKAPAKGQGGLTGFASGYAIYDALSDEQRAAADAAVAHYVEDGNWKHIYDMAGNGVRRINEPGEVEDSYDHSHQLVVQHPVTKRKALWTAPANLVALEGMGLAESQGFVEECLVTGLADPDSIYWHEYDDGDLLLNDDRAMMHTATPVGPDSGTRVLHLASSINRTPVNRGNWKVLQYAHDGDEAATENLVAVQERDEVTGHMRIRMVKADEVEAEHEVVSQGGGGGGGSQSSSQQ